MLTALDRKEKKSMTNDELKRIEFLNTVDTQIIEGSLLLLAKKKIILPERKIIVEKPEGLSLLQYQPDTDGEFGRTSTGIILSR